MKLRKKNIPRNYNTGIYSQQKYVGVIYRICSILFWETTFFITQGYYYKFINDVISQKNETNA